MMNALADLPRPDGRLRELALFAGAGGGLLASHMLGWRPVCAVENNEYAASVLVARQNDGTLPPFPIWADDIRGFDGRPWRGRVDVVSGGFPCTDISVAGKGAGIDGEHSGLWREMARIIREVRPSFVFIENSPALTTRGGTRVMSDLASMGFNVEWGVLGADAVGAWHERKRFWAVAHRRGVEWRSDLTAWHHANRTCARWDEENRELGASAEDDARAPGSANAADVDRPRELQPQGRQREQWRWAGHGSEQGGASNAVRPRLQSAGEEVVCGSRGGRKGEQLPFVAGGPLNGDWCEWHMGFPRGWTKLEPMKPGDFARWLSGGGSADWDAEWPDVPRTGGDAKNRVQRITALGNAQVPACAALAWRTLMQRSLSNKQISRKLP
jgi:DNA (cytosine-5)-methyltransferase 1